MKRIPVLILVMIISLSIPHVVNASEPSESDALFRKIAEKLSSVVGRLPNRTIAVYGFEVIGKPGDTYAKYATEKLTHEIVAQGELTVIERSRIDQVLKEQSLSLTGAVDSGTAAKIGKILSVDAVVIGTIHITHGRTEFIARVIQSEKGIILASADEKIEAPADEGISDNADGSGDTADYSSGNKNVDLQTSKTLYTRFEQVTIKFSGLSGSQNDWITLVSASEPDTTYGDWFYTYGKRAGSYTFKPVEPGDYEIRVYFDWPDGGYVVQKRVKIKVK